MLIKEDYSYRALTFWKEEALEIWVNRTPSSIAEAILSDYGHSTETEASASHFLAILKPRGIQA